MQFRTDAKNGNELSALGFGCMRFPTTAGRIDIDASERLIVEAVERGVNYLDTAYLYNGNEAALGEIFARNPGLREKVHIATKLPMARCEAAADFDKYLGCSLERLRTDHIDYYLVHNVTSAAAWDRLSSLGFKEWVDEQKSMGRIANIGFSYHGPKADFPTLLDSFDWDFCQIQYNYMNENYQAGTAGAAPPGSRPSGSGQVRSKSDEPLTRRFKRDIHEHGLVGSQRVTRTISLTIACIMCKLRLTLY